MFTWPHFHAHKWTQACIEMYRWQSTCTHMYTLSLPGTHRGTHVHVLSGLNCYGAWCCFTGPDKDKVDQIPSSCFSFLPFTFLFMCQWHTPCLGDGALIEKGHSHISKRGEKKAVEGYPCVLNSCVTCFNTSGLASHSQVSCLSVFYLISTTAGLNQN